jgi:hypothetical protein
MPLLPVIRIAGIYLFTRGSRGASGRNVALIHIYISFKLSQTMSDEFPINGNKLSVLE